jgi:endonuclease YncB( thermonuclease family)
MRLFFVAPWILLFSLQAAWAETFEGRVVSVHDGDTVTLLVAGNRQVKVRLAQIDAPESAQAFGQKSKQSLSDLVFNKTITVEKETVDRYKRTVGTLFVDGLDVNKEQVRKGMAWAYKQYLHDQSLLKDEESARQSKIGLWLDPNPVPPWEFRHGSKKANKVRSESQMVRATEKIVAKSNASCGEKRYCKEMSSCNEAMLYLNQCGLNQLDRDGDGTPCESLCGKDN